MAFKEIVVKFKEGGRLEARDGALQADHLSLGRFHATLESIEGSSVHSSFDLEAETVSKLESLAKQFLEGESPRLDLFVRVRIPEDEDLEATVSRFADDDEVEYVCDAGSIILASDGEFPTPNFTPLQGYLDPSPVGLSLIPRRSNATGGDIGICCIEFGFNPRHLDLPTIEVIYDPSGTLDTNADHGTAVLGEMAGRNNQTGVTGIAFDAGFYFASIAGGSLPTAIGRALERLKYGDVVNISLQSGEGLPVESVPDVFAGIQAAVASGISVVEAAGNYGRDLTRATNTAGRRIWDPESPEFRDSGAILATAGVPFGDPFPHTKLELSTYGARVTAQGWGRSVVTCGFGDLYDGGENDRYTSQFGATSSCAPMISGLIACLQSSLAADSSEPLAPLRVRELLSNPRNGTPQASSPTFPADEFHIGPLPDLAKLLSAAGRPSDTESAA